MRLNFLCAIFLFFHVADNVSGQDWKDVPIPAEAPEGKEWVLQPVSDDFSYESSGGKRPKEFTDRWKDNYLNGFSGPSCTSWHSDHTWTKDGLLSVHANWDPKVPIIYAGCLLRKTLIRIRC